MSSNIDAGSWTTEIGDQGPGLDIDQLPRMFDRFQRFGRVAEDDRGTGLGLAICRSIVDLHGGTIEVSRQTQGTGLRVAVTLDRTPR